MLDTYLYSDSYRSEIRTFSALASNSMLSSVGEYTSFAMLLIVDFEIPVIMDSCRTEMFLSYIILFNNIFMFLLLTKSFLLYWKIILFIKRVLYYEFKVFKE